MPENSSKRQANSNVVSSNIQEALCLWKIHDSPDQGAMAQSSPYPDRPGERDCVYYLRTGLCGYGNNCRYNHPPNFAQGTQFTEELPERDGQPDCEYYLKTGTCKYGSTCKFHHPKNRNGAGPVSFNILGLPMRQDEKSCPYYMRTGSCKFGIACKFHHPQPSSVGSSLPAGVSTTLASRVPSITPPSGLSFVGVPTWSPPRAPYVSSPRLQIPQAYMPVIVSPSQGVLPGQGWHTYVGNFSTMSPPNIPRSNLVYNSRNQVESGGQVHFSMITVSNLPERPDQPECRHFMSTGTCKFGSDCRYHHPKERKERVEQLADSIGPLGLPSRPGQAICSNYNMYGICKFGPSCRYDHPFPGYPYGYSLSLNLPTLSMFDSSVLTYPRTSPGIASSDTLPSSRWSDNWVQNSEAATNKNEVQGMNTKNSDDPSEAAVSPPPHFSQSSSEPSHY
ncbi:hypothetical protein K2173_018781 [Erythroxylum novogranatense]|uniref:C3H1-type domain-containing protein n=1 Tax=Erythroxylum novogranatense TaxID=1862640 RepID=A0AAV8SB53_9ROSI|nr:hypothetical protein K2173_018781 [Erythroxylum novogranatense]